MQQITPYSKINVVDSDGNVVDFSNINSGSSTKKSGKFIAISGTGSTPEGAIYLTFAFSEDATGSIDGTTFPSGAATITFDPISQGYQPISYSITSGTAYLIYAI